MASPLQQKENSMCLSDFRSPLAIIRISHLFTIKIGVKSVKIRFKTIIFSLKSISFAYQKYHFEALKLSLFPPKVS